MKIAIIGGGAAGLMCGALLAQGGLSATIFDGNEKLGKKLYITGKGRCNLTNLCPPNEFLENVVRGKKFMISPINRFSSQDCMDFFEAAGLRLKTERGNRVFPASDKSSDVIKTLQKLNAKNTICLNTKIKKMKKSGDFVLETEGQKLHFDVVVVATGGKSYSSTGSTGDGYNFAKSFGHKLVEIKPALTAIALKDDFCKALQGLSLKNVALAADFVQDGKKVHKSLFGEMLFTDLGISGPIVLSLSSMVNRADKVNLTLDFKPALSPEQVDGRLLRDFDAGKNKNISSILDGLLPKKLAQVFLQKLGLPPERKVNSITKAEREEIAFALKNFQLHFDGLYPLESGIVTSGGVDTSQVNPKSCESRLCPGLYFIGEVLDVDCLTGGFNIQSAFSTAYACAQDILSKINEE